MKGVKRRFANVRNIALFISIFMFISLFSNITVKADELENGEVNPVVSEQAELQSNEELKELLDRMLADEVFLRETGTNAGYYVTSNAGAMDKILSMINF